MSETYMVNVFCRNCQNYQRVAIRRGVRVVDTRCPYCGCKALITRSI